MPASPCQVPAGEELAARERDEEGVRLRTETDGGDLGAGVELEGLVGHFGGGV